jgi:hypothetical protein
VAAESGLRGRPGRTLSAVALTLIDVLDQVFSAALLASPDQDVINVGGLRAGFARAGVRTLEFHNVQYVPGVRVNGTLHMTRRPHGVLRVSGRSAARGRLVFRRSGAVTGRLGGRRVHVSSAAAAAGSSDPLVQAAGRMQRVRQALRSPPRPSH